MSTANPTLSSFMQDNNATVKTFGEKGPKAEYNHVDPVQLLDIATWKMGPQSQVAGLLPSAGARLNQVLINFAPQHAYKARVDAQTPFFMRQSIMAECAQLNSRRGTLSRAHPSPLLPLPPDTVDTTCRTARTVDEELIT
jgi:hypothetical protein